MTVQEQSGTSKDEINSANVSLIIAEYTALREEILKRLEIDHQLIALALIAPGTILTIGFQTRNASIMLVYPILALFLSAIWVINETGILEKGIYIRDHIESRVGENNIGWQHFKSSQTLGTFRTISLVGSRALFIGTELLAILAAVFVAKFDITENVLLIIAIVCIILTLALLVRTPLQVIQSGWKRP